MAVNSPAQHTVADIVIADPATARVFERFGIDYCCHGQRPLGEACADAGVDEADVQTALEALALTETGISEPGVGGVGNPSDIGGLIGHIVSVYHLWLRVGVPRFEALFVKVIDAHAEVHPELAEIAATYRELVDDLMPHLLKEERILFPLAIELLGAVDRPEFSGGSVRNPISVMQHEHDRVGELLATLRRQTRDYAPPTDACPTWRSLWAGLAELESETHQHIHLENNVLFPMIVELEASLG